MNGNYYDPYHNVYGQNMHNPTQGNNFPPPSYPSAPPRQEENNPFQHQYNPEYNPTQHNDPTYQPTPTMTPTQPSTQTTQNSSGISTAETLGVIALIVALPFLGGVFRGKRSRRGKCGIGTCIALMLALMIVLCVFIPIIILALVLGLTLSRPGNGTIPLQVSRFYSGSSIRTSTFCNTSPPAQHDRIFGSCYANNTASYRYIWNETASDKLVRFPLVRFSDTNCQNETGTTWYTYGTCHPISSSYSLSFVFVNSTLVLERAFSPDFPIVTTSCPNNSTLSRIPLDGCSRVTGISLYYIRYVNFGLGVDETMYRDSRCTQFHGTNRYEFTLLTNCSLVEFPTTTQFAVRLNFQNRNLRWTGFTLN